ncbi:MAG: ABC transporter permease [Candidatus Hydrogenedentes bacterium]|nr:ABC transporter permease [Candidatus Hydrogenedentota bacterium]
MMNAFLQDLRFGLRTLFKRPGFVLVAALSLGLGIGSVATVYSMVDQVVWNPLPFDEPDRITSVMIKHESREEISESVSYPLFLDLQKRNEVFEFISAFSSTAYNLIGPDGPERVRSAAVTSSFFPLVRVAPILGRTFTPDEDEMGGPRVAILTETLWERLYQRRPAVIGESLTLDGQPFTIVGVMPKDFLFLETGEVDLWVPVSKQGEWTADRGSSWLRLIARLKPGASTEQADANLASISRALEEEFPVEEAKRTAQTRPFGEVRNSGLGSQFVILFGCVGFVLLIACVNVANLLLARVSSRQKEITIRIAMGASRLRLVRQLLTESLVLAVLGGVAGILISLWGIDFIISLLPAEEADFYVKYFAFGIDRKVIGFTMIVALGSAFLFGLVPAIQASRPDINECLKEGGGAGAGIRRNRLLSALVVAEVSLALILLVAAGLMIKSFLHLQGLDPGINPANLLETELHLPRTNAMPGEEEEKSPFYGQLYERLTALGGVEHVAMTSVLPYEGSDTTTSVSIEGLPDPPPGEFYAAGYRVITPGYFETMQTPVKQGREFTLQDAEGVTPVCIINEKMAEKYWPGESALGKRLRRGMRNSKGAWIEVVGVVGNVYHRGMGNPHLPEMYFPLEQNVARSMTVVARTQGDPFAFVPTLRRVVAEIDPNMAFAPPETMEKLINISLWERRFITVLFSVLAACALTLSTIGVYGVINYSVSQRTHEIGIRMALGAQAADVRRLVVRKGLRLALIGVVIGLPLAVGLSFVLSSMLYGVSQYDPVTFTGVAILLLFVAGIASYLPARKATRVDPMIALRYE